MNTPIPGLDEAAALCEQVGLDLARRLPARTYHEFAADLVCQSLISGRCVECNAQREAGDWLCAECRREADWDYQMMIEGAR